MSEETDIQGRLRDACVGHPFAKVPWPHRLLHEAADEIDRLRKERDDHEQARTALEEALAQTTAELRAYQRATIQRDETVLKWAFAWRKDSQGSRWIGEARSLDVTRIGNPNPRAPAYAPAPDLRPNDPGPITLPIVDLE